MSPTSKHTSGDSGRLVLKADAQPDEPARRDGTASGLSPKYAAALRAWQAAHRAAQRAVEKDAEEKDRHDLVTVLERAQDAKEEHGEMRTEDAVDLLVGMLRANDGEMNEEYIKKLLSQFLKVPLGNQAHVRALRAFDAAARRGKRVKHLRRMYQKGLRRRSATG